MYKFILVVVKVILEKVYRFIIIRVLFFKSCLIFGLDIGEKNVLLNYDIIGKNFYIRYLLSK